MREIILARVRDPEAKSRRDFTIIEETQDYIVVDKPPQLLIHPSKPERATTLWAELRQLLAFEIENGGSRARVWATDAISPGRQRISRHGVGLAGVGLQNSRCATYSPGPDRTFGNLSKTDN